MRPMCLRQSSASSPFIFRAPTQRSKYRRVDEFVCQSVGSDDFRETAKKFVSEKTKEFSKVVVDASENLNTRAEEAFKETDRKYSINRRFKNFLTDFKRRLPYWRRQLDEFGSRPIGKLVLWTTLCLAITSGVLFRVLNIMFLVWWMLPLLMLPFAGAIRKQAAQRMEEEQARVRAEAEQAERARNPFSAFGSAMGGMGRRPTPRESKMAAWQEEGPILDAEWTTIDDDEPKSRRKW